MSRRRAVEWVLAIALIAAFLASWHAVTALGLASRAFVPAPLDVWWALLRGLDRGELGDQTIGTVERMLQGWLFASLAGVALGAAIGLSGRMRVYVQPTLEFMRPLPASAIIPIGIALFGLSSGMALFVIAFGSLWPTLLGTVHGFATVDIRLKEVARCLGIRPLEFAWKIGLPNAMPDILSGMRLSLTVALILAVICEMLAAQIGLGTAILLAARAYQSAELFAGIALLGAIGLVTNLALRIVESATLRWRVAS